MASAAELSTATSDWVDSGGGGTAGLQPRILPSSLANRNRATPEKVPSLTTKLDVGLKTSPVGPPPTLTTSGCAGGSGNGVPSPPYSVLRSVPLSETHHGVDGPAVRPQALTRFVSVCAATPAWSETSGVTVYEFRSAAVSGETATKAEPSMSASTSNALRRRPKRCAPISHAPSSGVE